MVDGISASGLNATSVRVVKDPTQVSGGALAPRPDAAAWGKALPAVDAGALTREMAANPPVDVARVKELRAAIQAGTYRVDAEKIADAMIAQETGR